MARKKRTAVVEAGRDPALHAGAVNVPVYRASTILYRDLARELAALLVGETDRVANAANMAAVIYYGMPYLNWAGFYFRHGVELVLGPFQGKPACVRIPIGRGVCGTAAARAATVLVPDVHDFPGHIACDGASRSELVVSLIEAVRSMTFSLATCSPDARRPHASVAIVRRTLKPSTNAFKLLRPYIRECSKLGTSTTFKPAWAARMLMSVSISNPSPHCIESLAAAARSRSNPSVDRQARQNAL